MHVITDAGIYYGLVRLNTPANCQLVVPSNFDQLHTSDGALPGKGG